MSDNKVASSIFNLNPYNTKPVRVNHKVWLMNFKTSYDMKISLEYVGVSSRQLDILFDMNLIERTEINEWGQYKLSHLGAQVLDNYMELRKMRTLKLKSKK